MGEEVKQEEPKVEEKKGEEVKEKAPEEEKPPEEKKEAAEEEPKPPEPCILFVDLHCVGCAKKIQRSIMNIRGVEGVVVDMGKNQVTIKGIVNPEAVCTKIMKKTKRTAKVISPLPPPDGEPLPQLVTSQVSGLTTVELNVNMHCEACADQLKRKILKMRGVQSAVTELSTETVTVTGTMDANKLVDYLYRHTRKQARIVPQPEPEPQPEEPEKQEAEKPATEAEEPKPEEKKEEQPQAEDAKKTDENENKNLEEKANNEMEIAIQEEHMNRMMYYYRPRYVIEQIPPPQLFSDENPNACCIS